MLMFDSKLVENLKSEQPSESIVFFYLSTFLYKSQLSAYEILQTS